MRKLVYAFTAMSMLSMAACGDHGDKNESAATEQATEQANDQAPSEDKGSAANQPKSYKVSFAPDSAILGKSQEALIRLTGGTALVLSDPDGKETGIELVINLQATNRQKIEGGNNFSVSYQNARLQLDNGNNITVRTGTDFLSAQPESTSKVESWTFDIPTGTKPSTLTLFLDGTRVSVGVKLD